MQCWPIYDPNDQIADTDPLQSIRTTTRDLLLASLDLHFVCNLPVQTDIQDIYHRYTKHDTVQADMFGVYIYV